MHMYTYTATVMYNMYIYMHINVHAILYTTSLNNTYFNVCIFTIHSHPQRFLYMNLIVYHTTKVIHVDTCMYIHVHVPKAITCTHTMYMYM